MAQEAKTEGDKEKHNDFLAEALADYYAVADDELDLRTGEVYTIIEVSESGWWYALDNENIDGWVPSNYLEKLDAQAQQNYLEEQAEEAKKKKEEEERKKKEKEEKKRKKKEEKEKAKAAKKNKNKNKNKNNGNNKNNSGNSDEKTDEHKQYGQTTDAQVTFSTVDAKGNKLTTETRPNSRSYAARNGVKSDNWGKKKDDEDNKKSHQWAWKNKNFVSKDAAKEKEAKERDIEEEKKYASLERPKLTTVNEPDPNPLAKFSTKPVNEWSLDEIVDFLTKHPNTNNTFQLKSAIGYLNALVTKDVKMKEWVLTQNGLNIILNVLRYCDKDIAVAMSCCLALTTLCQHGASQKYTAEKAGVFYLTTAIRASFQNPRFCYAAFNCVCNFTNKNQTHKDYILNDEHNKTIITYIIEGMQKFRYEEDSDQNYHCTRVQTAACLALQNLAADPKGQAAIGKEGVSQVLDALIAHVDNPDVVSAALGTLSNLLGNESNGIVFLQEDGLMYVMTLLQNPDVAMEDRLVCARLMQNLALKPKTAEKLAKMEEAVDLSIELLINADFGSDLYCQSLKFVNALILRCPDAKKKEKLMKEFNEQNLIDIVSQALTETFEDLMEQNLNSVENRNRISGMYASIAAVLLAYFKSPNKELSKVILQNSDNADLFIPNYLIQPCIDCPSPHLLYNMISIGFALADNAKLQKTMIEGGLLKMLFNSEWYKTPNLDDNVLKLGCGLMLKLLSAYANHRAYWKLSDNLDGINGYTAWLKENKPQLQQLNSHIEVKHWMECLVLDICFVCLWYLYDLTNGT